MQKILSNKRFKYYLFYTIIFAVCCAIAFSFIFGEGKTLIYNKDGWHQYLKSQIYFSNYLKELFHNIFVNHVFDIPEWSFSIGEGNDILGTFHCYLMGDPIALLSIFFNEENMYIFYNLSIVLRLYLSGIAFSEFCFYHKQYNLFAVLGGAVAYTFCFWSMFNSVRHLHFLNPMIIFPFLIMSIDRLIDENKCYMFTFMVFAMAIVNFYFFAIFVILVVVYVIIRLLVKYKNDIKSMALIVFKLFIYSLIGVLMAAVIILPMLFFFTDDFRLSVETQLHFIYPINYYKKLPSMFLSTSREYWMCIGLASPVLIGLFSLLKRGRKNVLLFILAAVSVIFIITPIFGQATNGFRYVTNKWSFSLALLYCYILVNEWEHIKENKLFVSVLYIIVLAGCVVLSRGYNMTIPLVIGLVFLALVWINKIDLKYLNSLMILLICVCVCFNAAWLYSPLGNDYAEVATTIEDDKNIANMGESAVISKYKSELGDDFYRYSGNNLTLNSSLLFNNYSTDLYWSLTNKYVSRYRNDIGLTEYSLSNYYEYDKRSTFYSLANVRYYVDSNDGGIPYNFEYYKTLDGYDFYINKSELPFGYTYDDYVLYEDWSKLNAVEKEEVLWSKVVLDSEDLENKTISVSETKDLLFDIKETQGVEIDGNKYLVQEEGGTVTLSLKDEVNGELFFLMNGLNYSDGKSWLQDPATSTNISVETSLGKISSIHYASDNDKYQHGRDTFAANLGLVDNQKVDTITISFADKGTYVIDDIKVVSLSMDKYSESMKNIGEDHLEDVVFSIDKVEGNISLDQDKYLVVSIPCAKGWKAYIDGEKTEIINANGAYIGIFVPEGQHFIEFKYQTPYLRLGLAISLLSTVAFVGFIVYKKKAKN